MSSHPVTYHHSFCQYCCQYCCQYLALKPLPLRAQPSQWQQYPESFSGLTWKSLTWSTRSWRESNNRWHWRQKSVQYLNVNTKKKRHSSLHQCVAPTFLQRQASCSSADSSGEALLSFVWPINMEDDRWSPVPAPIGTKNWKAGETWEFWWSKGEKEENIFVVSLLKFWEIDKRQIIC